MSPLQVKQKHSMPGLVLTLDAQEVQLLVVLQSQVVQLLSSAIASNFGYLRNQTVITSTIDSRLMGRWARMEVTELLQPATVPRPRLGLVLK